jgi:hypothetical protein
MKKYRKYRTRLQCKKVELNRLNKDKNRKYNCPVQLAVYSQTVEGTIYLTLQPGWVEFESARWLVRKRG